MNLVYGELMDDNKANELIDNLNIHICETLCGQRISIDLLIKACDEFSKELTNDEFLPLLRQIGVSEKRAIKELEQARKILSQTYLKERLKREFILDDASFVPWGENDVVTQRWEPIGVLFHISAGNMEALPAFSVLEGLLTGNINILKLSGEDDGISAIILHRLIKKYPLLAKFIYVFDFSSRDFRTMKKLAKMSNAIVVWGGDEAIKSIRKLSDPNTKIIEWGNKISFAYVDPYANKEEELELIAINMCGTEQLHCNSCQGIYLDTDDRKAAEDFAKRFLDIFDSVSCRLNERSVSSSMVAKATLQIYTERLMSNKTQTSVFSTGNCSVTVYPDAQLTSSYMFRNCWIKMLARRHLISVLHPNKEYLQTAALICRDEDANELESLLARAGIVRIVSAKNLSKHYCGQPHDGRFALREYCKRISIEL